MNIPDAIFTGESSVAVVGLGYVGLPLAVALSRHFSVIGFDISHRRVDELQQGHDSTAEVESAVLCACNVHFTTDPTLIGESGVIIVAVPTPIDCNRRPDLVPIMDATRTVGQVMKKNTVVVYESTVYPGLTEEVCVPILEHESGLAFGSQFTVGYSPERINPGDKTHTLETITKIVSGSDKATVDLLQKLYGTVVTAGIFCASSIRVAEAAKVIENTQRDLNIALMNELAILFDRMDIDTLEVLEAAGTKWNFLPFRPGLVGGHCIGVDPYYLTYKAEALGHHPQVILAGRRINDGMGKFIAEICIKKMIRKGYVIARARVGILGLTFKENVPDLRNTRVIDVIRELRDYGVEVLVHDPQANATEAQKEYGLDLIEWDAFHELDAVILAVPHKEYLALTPNVMLPWFRKTDNALLFDVKGALAPGEFTVSDFDYWRL